MPSTSRSALVFFLALTGCPSDDDDGAASTGDSSSTTTGIDRPGGGSTSGETSNGGAESGDAAEAGSVTTGPPPEFEVCPGFATWAECDGAESYDDMVELCTAIVSQAYMDDPACGEAWEASFVCMLDLDCTVGFAEPAPECQAEYDAIQELCPSSGTGGSTGA